MTETPAEGTESGQTVQPVENAPVAAPQTVQPEAQAAPQNVQAPPPNDALVAEHSADSGDTFSEHPEVGEIIVDDKNRPFLVLDVNETDGSVIGLAFNLDGSSEVVTERSDHGE